MNSRLVDSLLLWTVCPHCGHAEADDYEVIEQDRLHAMRCSECGGGFCFIAMECTRCTAEALFTWARDPGGNAPKALSCLACKQRYEEEDEVPLSSAGLLA